jgi:hypothetical protein
VAIHDLFGIQAEATDLSDWLIQQLAWCRFGPVAGDQPERGLTRSVATDGDTQSCGIIAGGECRVLQL